MKDRLSTSKEVQAQDMKSYYAFQAKIYDFTRWTFLYGRNTILKKLPIERDQEVSILEVGCGTGVNLRKLAKLYPKAQLHGIDISGDMLHQAEKNLEAYKDRIVLEEKPYEKGTEYLGKFDVILFSYALTMINPQWKELVEHAPNDLKDNGLVAVVDFHDANFGFYRRFMRNNHVRLDGHILPELNKLYQPQLSKVKKGLVGVWDYMMFIGFKK